MKRARYNRQVFLSTACGRQSQRGMGNIVLHGYFKVQWGRRGRYRFTTDERSTARS